MTLDERLWQAGTIGAWDQAVRRRDRAAMIALLGQVAVGDAPAVADAVLADPDRYPS